MSDCKTTIIPSLVQTSVCRPQSIARYHAVERLQLGWATPVKWLHSVDLPAGSFVTVQLPALVDNTQNTLVRTVFNIG